MSSAGSVCSAGAPGLIKAWYTFPEVRETWLGFTRTGNTGRGLGSKFANSLHRNLSQLFSKFGSEQITKGSHLEKLCLIDEGVGRDNISDFTTNLIKEFLLEYTQEFSLKHLSREQVREFAVGKVRFSYDTQSWVPGNYTLPVFQNTPIILTPRDMLSKDNTWINRPELIEDFWNIPESIPNAALRAQINNYFLSLLPKQPKKVVDTRRGETSWESKVPDSLGEQLYKRDVSLNRKVYHFSPACNYTRQRAVGLAGL